MSDVDVDIPARGEHPGAQITFGPPAPRRGWWQRGRPRFPHRRNGNGYERPRKPRVRKLRLLLIVTFLAALAFVSTVFGMMMAVASDLPQIENITQYKKSANSYLYDDQGRPIGAFSAPDHAVIDPWRQHLSGDDPRGRLRRGQALLDRSGSGYPRYRPRVPLRRHRRGDAGRLDNRRAVRQERPQPGEQPDGVGEAARGGARVPANEEVAADQDHHAVPEHDLLRQRRVRDRVGRPRLLRQGTQLRRERRSQPAARGVRRRDCAGPDPADVRLGAAPVGVGAACRDDREPERVQPVQSGNPSSGERPPQPGAAPTCTSRAT